MSIDSHLMQVNAQIFFDSLLKTPLTQETGVNTLDKILSSTCEIFITLTSSKEECKLVFNKPDFIESMKQNHFKNITAILEKTGEEYCPIENKLSCKTDWNELSNGFSTCDTEGPGLYKVTVEGFMSFILENKEIKISKIQSNCRKIFQNMPPSSPHKYRQLIACDYVTKLSHYLSVTVPPGFKQIISPQSIPECNTLRFIPDNQNSDEWNENITFQNFQIKKISARDKKTARDNTNKIKSCTRYDNTIIHEHLFFKNIIQISQLIMNSTPKDTNDFPAIMGIEYFSGGSSCIGIEYTVVIQDNVDATIAKVLHFFSNNIFFSSVPI